MLHILAKVGGLIPVFKKLAGKIGMKAAEGGERRVIRFHAARDKRDNGLCLVAFAP